MISTQFCPACGAANELAHTRCFACGQLLATSNDGRAVRDEALLHERYQLGATLGSGGFSAVYRARDVQSGREVAIKQVMLGGLSTDETIQATDTFNRELSLLSALHHPQVPRIYDHFSDREHWYLVMEYLQGTTLETYLHTRAAQGKPIQVDEALAMALQLCRVLEYLHTREPPVIFRDLKPGNIIRAPGGTLCLIDFGIARHFRPGQARDTQPLGSPGYAAPEQYGRAQTTPQTDIYSLGALLHALLTGQDPAEQLSGLAPLRLGSSGAESELVALAQRMRSPAPSERPATVRDVATALEAIRQARLTQDAAHIWRPPTPQDLPPLAGGQHTLQLHRLVPPGTSSFSLPSRRVGRREVLIGLGVLAAAVAGGGIWRMHTPPSPYLYQGHADAVTAVAWSPDGGRIASGSDDMTVQVWDAADGGHVYTYQGHSDQVIAVAWSPDGRRIASGSVDHTVQVWDAASGGRIFIYQGHLTGVAAVAWSPDGGRIASASYKTVQIWDPTFGDHFYTYSVHTDWVCSVSWSPDGRHIASAGDDSTVQVWDAANGGHVYTFRGHAASVYAVAWSHDSKHIASASADGTVQVWDAFTGGHVLTYRGHADAVTAVAWSPDGRRIASASWDQTVQVWDAFTGEHVQTYRGHTRPVIAVAWSPAGGHPVLTYSGRIASGSLDKTVQVWNAL